MSKHAGCNRPEPGPVLTLAERDRRWSGLRTLMAARDIGAILVGTFQGRERLESYLIDDFHDSVVIFPVAGEPTVLSFSPVRISRAYESAQRGGGLWVTDYRIGFGGEKAAEILREKGLAKGRVGLVGIGPTAPGEMEGLIPLGFYQNLVRALPKAQIEDFTRDFTDFVLIKGPEELALMRFAAKVSEHAGQRMIDACAPGVSEAEVYADILHEIHRWGCDVRYPFLSLQSGADNISWGVPRWTIRAEPPRILERGDLVQAEIHTCYGGQEAQIQMSVALDPVDEEIRKCERVARQAYDAGIEAIRPGVAFAEVVHAMEAPIAASGCWSRTPLLHTATFGATGFTPVNRGQLVGTRIEHLEAQNNAGIRRGDLVLRPGMALEVEPNACLGTKRVNIGGIVMVTETGAEPLNEISTRVHHVA